MKRDRTMAVPRARGNLDRALSDLRQPASVEAVLSVGCIDHQTAFVRLGWADDCTEIVIAAGNATVVVSLVDLDPVSRLQGRRFFCWHNVRSPT